MDGKDMVPTSPLVALARSEAAGSARSIIRASMPSGYEPISTKRFSRETNAKCLSPIMLKQRDEIMMRFESIGIMH
jgi:hypothetical protein